MCGDLDAAGAKLSNLVLFPSSRIRDRQKQLTAEDTAVAGESQSDEFLLRLLHRLIRSADGGAGSNIETWIDVDRLVVATGTAVRGIWEMSQGRFSWIPAGYLLPHCQFLSVQDAARYTIHCIFQRVDVYAKPSSLEKVSNLKE
jgi:hypothetical protein